MSHVLMMCHFKAMLGFCQVLKYNNVVNLKFVMAFEKP